MQFLDLLFEILLDPGLYLGFIAGGAGAWFFGVRNPLLLTLCALVGAACGVWLESSVFARPRT